MPLVSLLALAFGAQIPAPRYENARPIPSLPGVMIDAAANGIGFAAQTAKQRNLQARILWIDCTANIERYNSPEKIESLLDQIANAGFNTIVFDIKPISGQVIYPSKLAPKLKEWRGRVLPENFDPVRPMVEAAKRRGLFIIASLNAFSEGHQMFTAGPGYAKPEQQTVLYEPVNVLRDGSASFEIAAKLNTLEADKIAVFASPQQLPAPKAGAFVLTLDRFNRVVDGFEEGGAGPRISVPKGGLALYGTGKAAEFLQTLEPGQLVRFDTKANFVPIGQRPQRQIPLMMNPNDPAVRQYAVDVVREVATNYAFDGLVYDDRLRYSGLDGDFSPSTRLAFERHVGKSLNWPDDVFAYTLTPRLTRGTRPGRYFDAWMQWRAQTMTNFVGEVRQAAKQVRPELQFGVYAGSWYADYPALGSNWASPQAKAGFWFLTPDYAKTGFAESLDFLITGCYYPTATIYQALGEGTGMGETVEAAGMLTNRLVRDATWSYAGIALSQFKDDPVGLGNALQAACASTQGVMVFDLSHDIEPMWPVFAQAFSIRREAPHQVAGLLADVRKQRGLFDRKGGIDPPIRIMAGSTGTGQ